VTEERAHLEGLPVLVAVDNPSNATLIELLGQWRMAPTYAPDANTCLRELTQAASNNLPIGSSCSAPSYPTRGLLLAETITSSNLPQPCVIMLAGEGRRGDGALPRAGHRRLPAHAG
jgi:hypothetical protein